MNQRQPGIAKRGRSERLSLRECSDWRQLSRTRRESPKLGVGGRCEPDGARFEIERVDQHGIVGYHLVSRSV